MASTALAEAPDTDLSLIKAQQEPVEVRLEGSRETGFAISVSGLPAVSADGKQVAFLSTRSEYDGSSRVELLLVEPEGVKQRVLLENVDGSLADGGATLDTKQERLLKIRASKVQALFKTGRFSPIPAVVSPNEIDLGSDKLIYTHTLRDGLLTAGAWRFSYDEGKREIRVLDKSSRILLKRKIGLTRPCYCSSAEPGDAGFCTNGYSHVEVWGDSRVLFIRGGNNGGPDGCELEEQYLTVWPAQRKSRIDSNQRHWPIIHSQPRE